MAATGQDGTRRRGQILGALSVGKGKRSGRDPGRGLLREGTHGVVGNFLASSGSAEAAALFG